MSIAAPGQMQFEERKYASAVKRKLFVQTIILQARTRPLAQLAAQPAVNRHPKPLLGPGEWDAWQQARGEAAKQVFTGSPAPLPRERQPHTPLDDFMVEQRLADFEGVRHARQVGLLEVFLGQNVL